jgi:hypothetical protein
MFDSSPWKREGSTTVLKPFCFQTQVLTGAGSYDIIAIDERNLLAQVRWRCTRGNRPLYFGHQLLHK